ncbi:MAG: stage III sporulation protein AF [Kyrpidia tusciae]|nr:stage III sporulation protein AF [Kyrpidia tusciae]MBE3551618.1 stage III sporulation protein AF [Kyrpidia tusciae]
MDALVAWLRQVVLVLLAAAFLDWMLPTNTMQRYVKVVMGLVVVGTLLTPLMQVFHMTEAWKAAVASLGEPAAAGSPTSGLTDRVMAWEAQQAQGAWTEEIRRRVAERAAQASGHAVTSVQVEAGPAAPGPVPKPPVLRRIVVVLGPPLPPAPSGSPSGSGSGATGSEALVTPVRPVEIGPGQRPAPSAGAALRSSVAQAVAADLGIDPSLVDVQNDTSGMGGGAG